MKLKASYILIGLALNALPIIGHAQDASSSDETTCDMGQLHEEMIDRFKLPEIPSSLSECGIGGFLNFDFSFGLGDFDFSSLFCDFANDVIGDFKENMSVDFDIGMNGISVNSPIYSVQTKGADEAVNELLYGATGVEQNGRGILGDVSSAYRDTLRNVRRDLRGNDSRRGSTPSRSISDVSSAVRNNSSYNIDDMRRNIDAIENVETTATGNTRQGNTTFNNLRGRQQSIGGEPTYGSGDLRLTPRQIDRFTSLPYDQIRNLDERELEQYLEFSEEQRQQVNERPLNNNSTLTRERPNTYLNDNRKNTIVSPGKNGDPIITLPDEDSEVRSDDPKSRLTELLFNRKER